MKKDFAITNTIYRCHDIGDLTLGHPRISIDCVLRIGKFCVIADDVIFLEHEDMPNQNTTHYPFFALFDSARQPAHKTIVPTIIGNDVYIGHGAIIYPGVTIGNGAIVQPGAVVTQNVEPYAIVIGNPAQVTGWRFEESWRNYINAKLKWWEWPTDIILDNLEDLLKPPGDHLFALRKKIKEALK